MEVAAPRLDDAEVVQVVKGEGDRAVPAGREPDEGAGTPLRDRPEVRIDIGRKLLRDGLLPVASRAPVQVLRVRVVVTRALRSHQDRARAQARKRIAQKADVAVRTRRGR